MWLRVLLPTQSVQKTVMFSVPVKVVIEMENSRLTINQSGHYKPSFESLRPTINYWAGAGFLPENIILKKYSHELVDDGFFG